MKYLGVFINSRTNSVDPSAALRKFFGCFNNILSVLGYGRDEMLAAFLAKTYCLPILLYGCETWRMSSSDKHKVNLMLHGITVSENFLMLVGAKVLNRCYITAVLCMFYYS